MEDNWMWYLVGAFDTGGTITVNIRKDDRLSLGFQIEPQIYFTRSKKVESVIGMVDEYCEENNIFNRIEEYGDNSHRIVITRKEDISQFLEPISDVMIQQGERVKIMLEDILPHFEGDGITSKEEFIEVMESVDKLKEKPISGRKESKYSAYYFRDEWVL